MFNRKSTVYLIFPLLLIINLVWLLEDKQIGLLILFIGLLITWLISVFSDLSKGNNEIKLFAQKIKRYYQPLFKSFKRTKNKIKRSLDKGTAKINETEKSKKEKFSTQFPRLSQKLLLGKMLGLIYVEAPYIILSTLLIISGIIFIIYPNHYLGLFFMGILIWGSWLRNPQILIVDKKEKIETPKVRTAFLIITLVIIFIVRLIFINWSSGYEFFHSGESGFNSLIKKFAAGDWGVLARKSQSIMIYLFGIWQMIIKTLKIDSLVGLRFIINIATFFNVILTWKIASLIFSKHRFKKPIAYFSLAAIGFSYFIIFYSNLVRPDIIILLIYNILFYYILKKQKISFAVTAIIAGVCLAFKGSGMLLIIINLALFILLTWQKENYRIIKILYPRHILAIINIIFISLLVYYFLTPYLYNNPLRTFETINKGLEHFGTGHYGLFPTNISFQRMILDRLAILGWSFSPFILLAIPGAILYLVKWLPTSINKIKEATTQELIKISLAFGVIIFPLYIGQQVIQFGRYYFPLLTLMIIFASYILCVTLRNKYLIILALLAILAFNFSFYPHLLNNSRIEASQLLAEIPSQKIYRLINTSRPWQYPPAGDKKYVWVDKIGKIPDGGYLIVPQHSYYKFYNYLKNPELYAPGDWYPDEKPEQKYFNNFNKIFQLKPVKKTDKKNFFWFSNDQLPYDIWYMTHPNYYIYHINQHNN
ncbi:MAG: hypothetical protein WC480_00180 [Patescibacteria group bacterium]